MTEVISVRFKNKGKAYFFDPNGVKAEKGDSVIVETSKGLEFAECAVGNHDVPDDDLILPLRPVIRLATEEDKLRNRENCDLEQRAMDICQEKIKEHGLDMKLVDVEYNFEGTKILFFFTSDGRVDFRELVKDLASVFKTRIELRQIGVRDEARMLGGLGICGKPFCCAQFLDDFQPVSIKMAKTQGLSLNPTKISGTCGRLMCCLKYEQDAYEDLVKNAPKVDAFVDTPAGKGSIMDINLLRRTARVHMEETADSPVKIFNFDELEVLGGKAKRAEYLQNQERLRREGLLNEQKPAPKLDVKSELAAKKPSEPAEIPEQPQPKRERRPQQKQHPRKDEHTRKEEHPKKEEPKQKKPEKQHRPHQKPAKDQKPREEEKQPKQKSGEHTPQNAGGEKKPRQGHKPHHTGHKEPPKQEQKPKKEEPKPQEQKTEQKSGGHNNYRRRRYHKPKNPNSGNAGNAENK